MAFFAELKRRRVGRVAIAYGAIAWAVTEMGSVVLPALRVPEWTMTFIVFFLLVGFPIAMVLAWIFDVGPEGIQRTEPLRETPPALHLRVRMAYALVVVSLMAALGYLLYERGMGRAMAGEPRNSIAVLPFSNLSGDASKDYFSDGMSEELLNLLARVPGLQVASRTSSFAYKGQKVDIRKVGRELGVQTVLEGSVRQAGEQVRITAQLIDTDTGFHLWSETYDRRLEDIFRVQDEISGAIVQRLRIELAPEQKTAAQRDKAPTQNVRAYELYLQGRAVWKLRGADNLRKSIDLYQQALAHDPAFAHVHAALASSYVVLPGYTPEDDAERFYGLAEGSARQALVLDASLGEAHAVLAQMHANRGELLDAESGFFFAISLAPMEATPHHWYSILLTEVGRLDAALKEARRAQELDPGAPIFAANLANLYMTMGNNAEARRYAQLAAELGMKKNVHGIEAAIALREQRYEDALALMLQQDGMPDELKPFLPEFVRGLADPKARPGVVAAMQRLPASVAKQSDLIIPYLQLGQIDLVFSILNAALDESGTTTVGEWELAKSWSPEGTVLRRDPRFGVLAQRIGLLEYWKQYGYPDGCTAGSDRAIVCS